MFWALGAPWGAPKGVRAGPGTQNATKSCQFFNQMGRIVDISAGNLQRISVGIQPWWSHPLKLNFISII